MNNDIDSNSSTPTVAGRQMSSSLKERLKRCGRYHTSPSPLTPKSRLAPNTSHSNTPIPTQNRKTATGTPLVEYPASKCCVHDKSKTIEKDHMTGMSSASSVKRLRDGCESGTLPKQKKIKGLNSDSVLVDVDRASSEDVHHGDQSLRDNLRREDGGLQVDQKQRSEVTPLRSRSHVISLKGARSCLSHLKGNRLNFEASTAEPATENESKTNISTCQLSKKASLSSCVTDKSDIVSQSDVNTDSTEKMTDISLHEKLKNSEEELRQLQMVKMYRSKNNLDELENLITKWRSVSQHALQDLYNMMPEPKPTLTQLLQHLGIRPELVKYDTDTEGFDD